MFSLINSFQNKLVFVIWSRLSGLELNCVGLLRQGLFKALVKGILGSRCSPSHTRPGLQMGNSSPQRVRLMELVIFVA